MPKLIELRKSLPEFVSDEYTYNNECPGMFWIGRATYRNPMGGEYESTELDDKCLCENRPLVKLSMCRECWAKEVAIH